MSYYPQFNKHLKNRFLPIINQRTVYFILPCPYEIFSDHNGDAHVYDGIFAIC